MTKRILCGLLAAVCALAVLAGSVPTAAAAEHVSTYVRKMVRHYRLYGARSDDGYIETCLEKIKSLDETAGALWQTIMYNWAWCNEEMKVPEGVLGDGLPEGDSLCIVVLGYELNPDGSMKPELIARLETALRSAEKYPKAYVAVTGGGTALYSSVTEAEAMAAWLLDHGIDEKRLIIEKESYSTTYNAVNTYAILVRDYPEVEFLALVTSDYHAPWGWILFQTVCDYNKLYGSTEIPVIACAANPTDSRMNTMDYQAAGICAIAGIPY